jgi:hypothetical protein
MSMHDASRKVLRRNATSLLLAALALLGMAAPAKAAPPSTKAAPKSADPLAMRLAEADTAFAAEDYARALELYRQVDAITPTFATKFGIGKSLRGLGRLAEACEVLERLLRERGDTFRRGELEKLEQAVAALRASTALLEVQVSEPGAQVTVDNQELGTFPLEHSLRKMPGQVSVSVRKAGFEPFTQVVEVRPGETRLVTVTLAPERSTSWLVVRSIGPEPATLLIDGRDAGPLPFSGEIPAGAHRLIAKGAHGQSQEHVFSAVAKGRYEAELTLQLAAARLHVSAVDPEAKIQLDSVAVASGRYDGELPAGNHVVVLEKPGFEPQVIRLSLEPGERANLDNISLVPLSQTASGVAPLDYAGLYGRLALNGLIGRPSHSIYTDCPATVSGGSCKSWPVGGAEIDTRVGYSFGLLGVEGFLLLGSTFTQANMTFPNELSERESVWYGIARTERNVLVNLTLAGGIAGRISSQSQHLRLSSGWGLGLAWHKPQIGRTMEALPSAQQDLVVHNDKTASSTAGSSRIQPLIVWDADVELGSVPGLRLLLGLVCQLELGQAEPTRVGPSSLGYSTQTGAHLPVGGGEIRVWGSPAYYFGPRIGLAIGH